MFILDPSLFFGGASLPLQPSLLLLLLSLQSTSAGPQTQVSLSESHLSVLWTHGLTVQTGSPEKGGRCCWTLPGRGGSSLTCGQLTSPVCASPCAVPSGVRRSRSSPTTAAQVSCD